MPAEFKEKMKRKIKVGFFQFAPQFGEPANNLSKVVSALHEAEADIIVLPELAFTGYLFQNRDELDSLAQDPVDSQIVLELTALCRQREFFVVTGFAEKNEGRIFNSALVIGKDGVLHTYRKLHLFNTEIVTPAGDLVYRAKPGEEKIFIADIDESKARDKSMTGQNHLFKDRHPEFYTDILPPRPE